MILLNHNDRPSTTESDMQDVAKRRFCRTDDGGSTLVKQSTAIKAAIDAIDDDAWVAIDYWLEGGADVAETTYTAFKGTRDEAELRLIVRRVQPSPGSQLAMDVVFD